jgi:hypothetical protein
VIKRFRKKSRRDGGQATFEFVLLLPLFVMTIGLAVDLGLLMYQYVTASNAVRDAARYASVNCGSDQPCSLAKVQARAAQRSGGMMAANAFDVTWTGTSKGDSVVVRLKNSGPDQHTFSFLFLPFDIKFPVASCAQMRLERDETGTVPISSTGCN